MQLLVNHEPVWCYHCAIPLMHHKMHFIDCAIPLMHHKMYFIGKSCVRLVYFYVTEQCSCCFVCSHQGKEKSKSWNLLFVFKKTLWPLFMDRVQPPPGDSLLVTNNSQAVPSSLSGQVENFWNLCKQQLFEMMEIVIVYFLF